MTRFNSCRFNGNPESDPVLQSEQPLSKKRVLFCRNQRKNDAKAVKIGAPVSPGAMPVPFMQLFRFATRFELLLNFIGLIAAIGAGAARLVMTTFFGTLIQGFVNFEIVVEQAKFGDVQAQAQIPIAAVQFRHAAAKRATYLVYLSLGLFICTFIYMSVWVYTGEMGVKRLRERYFRAVLRQDINFFDRVGAGEIATRIQTDTHLVQNGMSENVAMVANMLGAFSTGFILAYARSWRLSLALSAIIPFLFLSFFVTTKLVSKYTQASLQHVASSGTIAEEVISTVRTAHAFGTQATLADIFDMSCNQCKEIDSKAAIVQGAGTSVFFFVMYSAYAIAFSFGTILINEGRASTGLVVNVLLAIFLGSISLATLSPKLQAITRGRGAASKLYEVIDRVPDIDSADTSGLELGTVEGHITFDHVNFAYPSRPGIPILKDLSVTFPAGESVALIGTSGSGKSTIISLVERFYDPSDGSIKLDGVDIKEFNIKWFRAQISLVSQEPILFATTIKENVAHGLIGTQYEYVTEEKKLALVKKACIDANADSFINELPLGYYTIVGERGLSLSGGQKQRIAIARAIISDPRILLLDEATSALDTRSEGVVRDALRKASAGRTTIIIAHRLSTIKDVDRIFFMADGFVLEQGTHSELLHDENSCYSQFVTAQKLREMQETVSVKNLDSVTAVGDGAEGLDKEEKGPFFGNITKEETKEQSHEEEEDHHIFYIFARMGKLNRANWLKYGCGFTAATLSGMAYPAFGIVYAKGIAAFSRIDPHQRHRDGDFVALWFFLIAIVSTLTTAIQNYMFASTSATLIAKLRSLSFRAILRQDIGFFDKMGNSSGKLTSNLSINPLKVNGLAGIAMGTIIQSISTLISGSILGLVYSWELGLVAIACIPVIVSTGVICIRVISRKDRTNRKNHENSVHLACEAAAAIRTVASLTREDDCFKQYSQSLEEPLTRSLRAAIWDNILFSISQSISYLVVALIYWYGSYLISIFHITNSAFFIVLMSTTFGVIQATSVFTFLPTISTAKGAGSDIIKLIDSVPEIDADSTGGKALFTENLHGRIRLQHIYFRYPTRSEVLVLRDLSLTVEPGTYTALVGASGSGKSSVIQLIERFYNPSAGQIYLDNELVTELNIQEYRKHIALVSQEPTLYAGTVRFNILLGAVKPTSEVSQEEIEQACRDANILDFINSLPSGFDTQVGRKGSQLSGGQKQRIAIARALIRNPKVLLLDEATSALDSSSENVVQEALDRASKGRTTIAIAHRLSTIQNANCIHFIKDGQICESGTHDELLQKRGEYYEHVQLQVLPSSEK